MKLTRHTIILATTAVIFCGGFLSATGQEEKQERPVVVSKGSDEASKLINAIPEKEKRSFFHRVVLADGRH